MSTRLAAMRHRLLATVIPLGLSLSLATPAAGQVGVTPLAPGLTTERPAGWTFTPAFDYAFIWDSNVLFDNVGSDLVREGLHVVKPNGTLGFLSERTAFDVLYSGAFVQHPNLSSLNSYDQRLTLNAMRQLTRRTSVFARHNATVAPTTELLELVGVPFTRLGVHRHELRSGVELMPSRQTQLALTYRFQWVDFRPDASGVDILRGGHNHGGNISLRRTLTRRTTLAGEYDLQQATVIDGGHFQIQNSWGGLEYRLTELTQLVGGVGLARLSGAEGRPAQSGPSMRFGVMRRTPVAEISMLFHKSYVPVYSFGGTSDNEELTTRLLLPIARRWTVSGSVSLRRNEPLDATEGFSLRSVWAYGSVAYRLTDWMRLEAYSSGVRQMSDQVDGRINRYTFGVQVTAATTTRIR